MKRHDIQVKGFQYGVEKFEEALNLYVMQIIILKLFPENNNNAEDSIENIVSKAFSPQGIKSKRDLHFQGLGIYYAFADKTLIPKTVAAIYGYSLDRLINEDISLFENMCKKAANQLAPKYFRMMADQFANGKEEDDEEQNEEEYEEEN